MKKLTLRMIHPKIPRSIIFLGAGSSCPLGLPTSNGFFEKFFGDTFSGMLSERRSIFPPTQPHQGQKENVLFDCLRVIECLREEKGNNGVFDIEEVLYYLKSWHYLFEESDQNALDLHSFVVSYLGSTGLGLGEFKSAFDSFQEEGRNYKSLRRTVLEVITWLEAEIDKAFGSRQNLGQDAWELWAEILRRAKSKQEIIPIFTTNYDSAFEAMAETVEFKEEVNLVDGTRQRGQKWFFSPTNYRKRITKTPSVFYAKLHGSLTWVKTPEDEIWHRPDTETVPQQHQGERCIIPPTLLKDESAIAFPFDQLYDILIEYLRKAHSCVVIGFSFRDEPIKKIFLDSIKKNNNLAVTIFDKAITSGPIYAFMSEGNDIRKGAVRGKPIHFGDNTNNYIGEICSDLGW